MTEKHFQISFLFRLTFLNVAVGSTKAPLLSSSHDEEKSLAGWDFHTVTLLSFGVELLSAELFSLGSRMRWQKAYV